MRIVAKISGIFGVFLSINEKSFQLDIYYIFCIPTLKLNYYEMNRLNHMHINPSDMQIVPGKSQLREKL